MPEDQELSQTRDVAPTPSFIRRKHRPGLQRVSIACERCRKRKNKCDRKLPECSTCKAAGAECVISDRVTNRQYPRAHVNDLENEVQELRSRIKELELQLGETTRSYSNHDQPSTSVAQTDGTPNSTCATEKTTTSAFDNIAAELSTVPHDVTSNQRYVGESSGLFFGKVVEAVLLHSDYKGEQGPSSESLRIRVAERPRSTSLETFTFPSPELAYRMQAAYFTCWWPALPFLHRPSFVNEHLAPTMTQPQPNQASVFLSLMVLALGAIELKRKDSELGNSHLDLFRCATQNYLSALLKEDSIVTIQGLLLMAQFSVNEHESANAWLITGQAVRTAIDLGLHRSYIASSLESVTLGTEMRKRVFWCTYALDRNISITLGRPCAIRDEDIDVPFPLNLTDDELQDGVTSTCQPTVRVALSPFDMSTFIHILELRRIQSRIQALFYSADTSQLLTRGVQYSHVEIRSQLDEWIARSPRYTTPTMATFQSTEWFEIACSHAMLLLYRPSPACPVIDAVALQICADSSISLISSYSSLYAKNKITYTWIALHSLFMASITMLYTLAVSPNIRASTTKAVVRSNVASCLALFQVMAEYWPLATRCHDVIVRFGNYTITLFDKPSSSKFAFSPHSTADEQASERHFGQINLDFMEWFGTRDRQAMFTNESENSAGSEGALDEHLSGTSATLDSFDMPLDDMVDIFQSDFDMTLPIMMAGFGYEAHSHPLPQVPSPSQADTSDVPKVTRRGASEM